MVKDVRLECECMSVPIPWWVTVLALAVVVGVMWYLCRAVLPPSDDDGSDDDGSDDDD